MSFTMYDDVNLSLIPKSAHAVAGYVGGRWPTYGELAKLFPHALRLSIAVNAEENAEVLDIERGDALPSQAPAWVRRQIARGVKRPVVYCAVSDAANVLKVLDSSGIKRSEIRLWTAHYTKRPHRCSSACGFGLRTVADATQYTDVALGRSLDASLCATSFIPSKVPVAVRRARIRAWIVKERAKGLTWAALKKTSQWRLWRRLGGR